MNVQALHRLRSGLSRHRRAVLAGVGLALALSLIDFAVRVVAVPRLAASSRASATAASLPAVIDPAAAAAEVALWAPGEITTQAETTFDIRLEAVFGTKSNRKAVLAFVPSSGGQPERHLMGHNDEVMGWVLQSVDRDGATIKRGDEERTLKMFPGDKAAALP